MSYAKNVGLIGAGNWGRNLLRNLHDLRCLKTVCDVNSIILEKHKQQYPDLAYTASFLELLQTPEIASVVVASSAASHFEIVKHCLNAGKNVFVEKPLSLKREEGALLVQLAAEKKRILMVGHILHYHPAIVKVKEMIDAGDLGKLQYLYSHRLNIGKLRTEENILWSFAPHDISVILGLVKENPRRVRCFGGNYITPGIYDTTLTELEFSSGIRAHIFVSWLHPVKEQRLVVIGSKSMLVFDDLTDEKLFLYPHTIEWDAGKLPVAHKAAAVIIPVDKSEPLRNELLHFLECVNTGAKPLTDGVEGLQTLTVLEQAEKDLSAPAEPPATTNADAFVHSSVFVDDQVAIGKGTKIWHFSHILKNTRIGERCVLGQNVMAGPDVVIGDNCKIQNNVSLYKGVTFEDDVFAGPSAVFTNVINPRSFIERKSEFKNTLVKRGASVGANATIICGITIGEYAFIGAGAVVSKDVPAYGLVYGVPAKLMGWVCRCGNKLEIKNKKLLCMACGAEYQKLSASTIKPA